MNFIRLFLSIAMMAISTLTFAAEAEKYALIYNGVSTCEGCPEAIADVAKKANLSVKYVSNPKNIPKLLDNATIFIIGGTEDNLRPVIKKFNKNIITSIKDYLNNGGKYLGICGGGFLAAHFGIIPATAVDYSNTSKAHLEKINWRGKYVDLYFQGGPAFNFNKDAQGTHIIAQYSNGDVAAFASHYGKGKVVVVGPHPEADKTWLEQDHINSDNWQPKQELAVELIKQMIE